jgi:L-asparaginase
VPLLFAFTGAPVRSVESALDGAAGLVVAGFGLGHVPSPWMPLLGASAHGGIPVVMASRTHGGPVGGLYAGAGGDIDARDRGLMLAGLRTPYSARIQLICAIGAGADPAEAFARPAP